MIAMLSIGTPFFSPRTGHGRVAVVLSAHTNWEETRGLVTASYRVVAPEKLTALLD
jgi:hypothetical protein